MKLKEALAIGAIQIVCMAIVGAGCYHAGESAMSPAYVNQITDLQNRVAIMQETISLNEMEIQDLKDSNAWAEKFCKTDAYNVGACNTVDWLRLYDDPENPGCVLIEVDYLDGTGLERFGVPIRPYESLRLEESNDG